MSQQLLRRTALALALATGCAGETDPTEVRSDKPRLDVSVPPAELAELSRGNSAFAIDLYKVLRGRAGGNIIYAPYSVSLALAMTYAGARTTTEQQMAGALYFPRQDLLHPRFNALDRALGGRGAGQSGADGGPFRLRIANALWGQQGYAFQPAFLDVLAEHYGAGLHALDFAQDPDAARLTINGWISKRTEERIPALLPPGSVSGDTRLVLTNAVYFNAAWADQFRKERTRDGDFHLLDGTQVKVPLMSRRGMYPVAEVHGVQVVELPYQGGEVSLLLFLPGAGRFADVDGVLDADILPTVYARLAPQDIILTLPRFSVEASFSLREALAALGVRDLFSPGGADLSGINGRRDLFVKDVHHQSFIHVTEAGTEAGGATGVVVDVISLPPQITVDRPFVFAIRDRPTGTILFLGQVVDPRSLAGTPR